MYVWNFFYLFQDVRFNVDNNAIQIAVFAVFIFYCAWTFIQTSLRGVAAMDEQTHKYFVCLWEQHHGLYEHEARIRQVRLD
jgi:hypothetical protein